MIWRRRSRTQVAYSCDIPFTTRVTRRCSLRATRARLAVELRADAVSSGSPGSAKDLGTNSTSHSTKALLPVCSRSSPVSSKPYLQAAPKLLLQGEPRVGKTTVLEKLVRSMRSEEAERVYWALSKAEIVNGERRAFAVHRSGAADAVVFATRTQADPSAPSSVSNYAVDAAIWEDVATEMSAARQNGSILIIDEIGEMQLRSPSFRQSVVEALADRGATLFASIPHDERDQVIRQFTSSPRVTMLTLTPTNEAQVHAILREELEGSLRAAELIAR